MSTWSPSTTTALGKIFIDGVIWSSEKKVHKNGSIQWNIVTITTLQCWDSWIFATHFPDGHSGMISMGRDILTAKQNSWNCSSLWVFTLHKDVHNVAVVGVACTRIQQKHVFTVKGDVSWFLNLYSNGCWIAFVTGNMELLVVLVEIDVKTTNLLWCTACGHNFITLIHNIGLYFQLWSLQACMGTEFMRQTCNPYVLFRSNTVFTKVEKS